MTLRKKNTGTKNETKRHTCKFKYTLNIAMSLEFMKLPAPPPPFPPGCAGLLVSCEQTWSCTYCTESIAPLPLKWHTVLGLSGLKQNSSHPSAHRTCPACLSPGVQLPPLFSYKECHHPNWVNLSFNGGKEP